MYAELMKLGFEYALIFNAIQIASAHRIHLELLSRFYTHNILSIHMIQIS
jgi:hypothetical protein